LTSSLANFKLQKINEKSPNNINNWNLDPGFEQAQHCESFFIVLVMYFPPYCVNLYILLNCVNHIFLITRHGISWYCKPCILFQFISCRQNKTKFCHFFPMTESAIRHLCTTIRHLCTTIRHLCTTIVILLRQ
jgi:hypothetical protein